MIGAIFTRHRRERPEPNALWHALQKSRQTLLANAVFSLFVNLLMLASPLYMMQIYNRVLPARSEATLLVLTGLVGFLLLALAVLDAVRIRVMVRVGGRLEHALGERVLEAIFRMAPETYGREGQQSIRDFDSLRQFLSSPMLLALFDIPWTPVFIIAIFALHPLLGSIALGGSFALIVLAVLNHLATRRRLEEAKRIATGAGGFVESSLRNFEALEAMGMLAHLQRRWLAQRNEILLLQSTVADRTGTYAAASKAGRLFLQTAVLAAGAYLAIHHEITAGAIIAASVLMSRGLAPVEQAIGSWRQFVQAHASYARLNSLLAQVPQHPVRVSLPKPRGDITVENLTAWPTGSPEPTLRGISFVLAAGEILAITGPSGSGKSTLVRQIVGVCRPYSGKVRLDGADIHAWNREELGPHIGYLPQDVELFDGTVAENISRFADLDSVKVVAAAERAGAHEMILRLPAGYETPVGPSGCALSGGQRQRVGLARALYGDPSLVVLDEPNSSLDQAGEEALAIAIAALKKAHTTVVLVSHRPNVLREVDQVMLIEEGRIRLLKPRLEVEARLTQLPASNRHSHPVTFRVAQ